MTMKRKEKFKMPKYKRRREGECGHWPGDGEGKTERDGWQCNGRDEVKKVAEDGRIKKRKDLRCTDDKPIDEQQTEM